MKIFKTNSNNIDIKKFANKELSRLGIYMFESNIKAKFFFDKEDSIITSTIKKILWKTASGSIYTIELTTKGYVLNGKGCPSRLIKNIIVVSKPVYYKETVSVSNSANFARVFVDFGEDWVTTNYVEDIAMYTENGTFYGFENLKEYNIA